MTLPVIADRPPLWVQATEDLSLIGHRALRALLSYWQARVAALGGLPSRADIDPQDMKAFLPHVMLIDVNHDPLAFRWRLLGTATIGWLHRDMTGRWFDTIYPATILDSMNRMYATTVHSRRPARFTGRAEFADRDHVTFETLHLPLRGPSGRVEMILGGAVLEVSEQDR